MRWPAGPWEAFALLTVAPVPASARAGVAGVLPWAPLVGLVLGSAAAGIGWAAAQVVPPLLAAVLVVAFLAGATRGLHLDGLADTADGFGTMRGRRASLAVMKASDVGPFGVVTLVLVLLAQVAALAGLLARPWGPLAVCLAVVVGRIALTRTGLPGVASASTQLGAAVVGTTSRAALAAWLLLTGATVLALGGLAGGLPAAAQLLVAGGAGLAAAELLRRRAERRFGGVTGDVMGAICEVATTVTLVVAVVRLGG